LNEAAIRKIARISTVLTRDFIGWRDYTSFGGKRRCNIG
jgi:hypothetical protein